MFQDLVIEGRYRHVLGYGASRVYYPDKYLCTRPLALEYAITGDTTPYATISAIQSLKAG